MPALSKLLVLLALFLLASRIHTFTSLSSVAGYQVLVNHLIRLQQPLSKPKSEPSHEPTREPTKRLGQDALLPGNLSSKRVLFRVSMMDDEIQSCKTHSEYTQSYQVAIPVPFVSFCSKSFGLAYCFFFNVQLFFISYALLTWVCCRQYGQVFCRQVTQVLCLPRIHQLMRRRGKGVKPLPVRPGLPVT